MEHKDPKRSSESEQHETFDRLLEHFDQELKDNLYPATQPIEQFYPLFRLQGGQPWIGFYSLPPDRLFRLAFSGTEAALGLSQEADVDLKSFLRQLSKVAVSPESFQSDKLPAAVIAKFVPMTLAQRCLRVMFVCQMKYGVSMNVLIEDASKGSREALLDLIKLDATFLHTRMAQNAIAKAELSGDFDFKSELADVIAPDQHFWSMKTQRVEFAFVMLSLIGDYANRPDSDWADFLVTHGFDDYADPANVGRQRRRYGLTRQSATQTQQGRTTE